MTTWNRLVQQWRKHAPTLAAVFALLAVVGGGVAVVQGRMLTAQGWIVPLGDVPEWVWAWVPGWLPCAAYRCIGVALRTG